MSKGKYAHLDAMSSADLSALIDAHKDGDDTAHDEHAYAVKVLRKRNSE